MLAVADIAGAATQTAQNAIDTRLTTAEGDITDLETEMVAARGGEADLDSRLDLDETDIANLQNEVVTARGTEANIDARLDSDETDISNLQTEVVAARGVEIDIDTRITIIQTEVETARGNKTSFETRMENVIDQDGNFLATSPTIAAWMVQDSPIRVSDTSFTVTGDLTGLYKNDLAIKVLSAGADLFTNVVSSSYSAPDTTVNITTTDTMADPISGIHYSSVPRESIALNASPLEEDPAPKLGVNLDANGKGISNLDGPLSGDSITQSLGNNSDKVPAESAVMAALAKYFQQAGAPTVMAQNDSVTVTHDSLSGREGKFSAQVLEFVLGATQNTEDIISDADAGKWDIEDLEDLAVKFVCDTSNTSGHFTNAGGTPMTVGADNTIVTIEKGVHFKLSGNADIFKILDIVNNGDGSDEIVFADPAGSALSTGSYDVEWVRGIQLLDDVVKLTKSGNKLALMILSDTSNGSTTFTDSGSRTHSITPVASVAHSTDSAAWGATSIKYGSADKLQIANHSDFDFGAGDFTIFFHVNGGSQDGKSLLNIPGSLSMGTNQNQNYGYYSCNFNGYGNMGPNTNNPYQTWDFVCIARSGPTIYLLINGVQRATFNIGSNALATPTGTIEICGNHVGYLDNICIVKGAALWTGNHAVTSAPPTVEGSIPNLLQTISTNDAGQIDTTDFFKINSGTITANDNGKTMYFAVSFDARISYSVFTGSVWKRMVSNNGGTWEYNNDATGDASESWVAATINTQGRALTQAVSAQSSNRMTKAAYEAVGIAYTGTGGFDVSQTTLDFAILLQSDDDVSTPTVEKFIANYDLNGRYISKSLGGSGEEFKLERVSDTQTDFTKLHAGSAQNVYCTMKI